MSVTSTMQVAVSEAFARRDRAARALVEDSGRIARACQDMAVRFRHGGKLIVFGNGGGGTDAAHIAVEFMHPVLVGKRALPAIALSNDAATVSGVGNREGLAETFAHQVHRWADPADMALGISRDGRCENVLRGLEMAKALGLFTFALTGGDGGPLARSPAADHVLTVASDDPAVVKEIHVTAYHVLWELVHVFYEQPGPPGAGTPGGTSGEAAR
ncbi:D-sedoheptulose 7-phosphate isomerase [Streptosporangium canum]|uniref:D-sedoheptulose 7-phosphate isomerase n=1 Tax=Streptosporangium canum TaxID=324952 RepID=A0A1I3XGR5_9ACTN|nr:SIS domain-containing protein [Streptosporangium canum]SFK18246.1 D-sedoheptulose 7-phosphate isomerase [Streptosporangium canum]